MVRCPPLVMLVVPDTKSNHDNVFAYNMSHRFYLETKKMTWKRGMGDYSLSGCSLLGNTHIAVKKR